MATIRIDWRKLKADIRQTATDLRALKDAISAAGKGTRDQYQAFKQLSYQHTLMCKLMAASRGKVHAFAGPDSCCSAIHWTSKAFKEAYHRQVAEVDALYQDYKVDKPPTVLTLVAPTKGGSDEDQNRQDHP